MVDNIIARRVAQARSNENPHVIARMPSGWLVIGDGQPLPGYCLLLADPVVSSINDLTGADRASYLTDMVHAGDVIMAVTGADRMNYEILCNAAPALHAHIIPRYSWEDPVKRVQPPFIAYAWDDGPPTDLSVQSDFISDVKRALG